MTPLAFRAGDAIGGGRAARPAARESWGWHPPRSPPRPFRARSNACAVRRPYGRTATRIRRSGSSCLAVGRTRRSTESSATWRPGDFIVTPNWSWHDRHQPDGRAEWCGSTAWTFPLVTTARVRSCSDGATPRQPAGGGSTVRRACCAKPWEVTDRALTLLCSTIARSLPASSSPIPSPAGASASTFDCWMHRFGPTAAGRSCEAQDRPLDLRRVERHRRRRPSGAERFAWERRRQCSSSPSWARDSPRGSRDVERASRLTDRPILAGARTYREETLSRRRAASSRSRNGSAGLEDKAGQRRMGVEPRRFELLTSALQRQRSTN